MVEFKKYLHGKSDAGSRLMFKFRSGKHGLNEELGRHRGREGIECLLCDDECESVSHVLWECPALGLDKLCSEFCLLFYSLMLQFSAHYSFNFTYYSFTMTIILFGNAYINNIVQHTVVLGAIS